MQIVVPSQWFLLRSRGALSGAAAWAVPARRALPGRTARMAPPVMHHCSSGCSEFGT